MTDSEIGLRELGSLVRDEGPLSPERSVRIIERASRAFVETPFKGRRTDEREQIYWLGAALFFALTGRHPALAGSPCASLFSPHPVPRRLDQLVLTSLGKTRERFRSIAAFRAALIALSFEEERIVRAPVTVSGRDAVTLRPGQLRAQPAAA